MNTARTLTVALALLTALCQAGVAQNDANAPADLQQAIGLVDRYYELMDEFWHHGRHDLCLATLLLIIDVDPTDCGAYSSAAWLMENELRDEDAEALLRDGIAKNPNVYDLHDELGNFLFNREVHDEAITHLETAASFGPRFSIHHTLAHAYELAGRPSDALNLWLWLEAADPDDPVSERQIDRILTGGPPTNTPATMSRWRNERKAVSK